MKISTFFKRIPIYIKVFKDKIEITNLSNGKTISKTAVENFSTNRFIISNFNLADNLIRNILID